MTMTRRIFAIVLLTGTIVSTSAALQTPVASSEVQAVFADQTLEAPPGTQIGSFIGWKVVVDRDTAIIGMTNSRALLYERMPSGHWRRTGELIPAEPQPSFVSGYSVSMALHGDVALIFGQVDLPVENGIVPEGRVYVFRRTLRGWKHHQTLTAPGPAHVSAFGIAMAMGNDYAMFGDSEGSVYAFKQLADGTFVYQQTLTSPTGSGFGGTIAADRNTVLIGAPAEVGGVVYMYRRSSGQWQIHQELTASDGGTFFGSRVALKDGLAVVSAPNAGGTSTVGAGAAYVFAREDGYWYEQQKLFNVLESSAEVPIIFAEQVAILEDGIVVSSTAYGPASPQDSATGFLYKLEDGTWAPRAQLVVGARNDSRWDSIAASGNTLFVGVTFTEPTGRAFVFESPGSAD